MDKNLLRKQAKNIRKSLNIETLSHKICSNFLNWEIFTKSEKIMAFYPISQEPNLTALFEDKNKTWFLPKTSTTNKTIDIYEYKCGDILEIGAFGVKEPLQNIANENPEEIEMAIIPALMVDKNGYRLGYGAGFYDRFIEKLCKDCIKVVPIPDELLVESIPADSWDVPIDYAVTQTKVICLKM